MPGRRVRSRPKRQFQVKYTTLAFYALCPFQQWVHRPVGGSGD